MFKRYCIGSLFVLLMSQPALAWNALGHKIITQLAYDQLTRSEKMWLNRYNRLLNDSFSKNVVEASVWLDQVRFKHPGYEVIHYMDIPFTTDGSPLPQISHKNALNAIQQSIVRLSSQKEMLHSKAIALRVLIHVTEDVHQPLHTVTRISRQYPQGDKGANLVLLHHNKTAKNLHQYWDRGAGLLVDKKRVGIQTIKKRARKLEARWPCELSTIQISPENWVAESHELATHVVYTDTVDTRYQRNAQHIVEQRMALAGCRLAAVLHHIANDSMTAPRKRVASPPVTAR